MPACYVNSEYRSGRCPGPVLLLKLNHYQLSHACDWPGWITQRIGGGYRNGNSPDAVLAQRIRYRAKKYNESREIVRAKPTDIENRALGASGVKLRCNQSRRRREYCRTLRHGAKDLGLQRPAPCERDDRHCLVFRSGSWYGRRKRTLACGAGFRISQPARSKRYAVESQPAYG